MIALFDVLLALAGLLLWLLASNGKVAEAGKIMLFCGMFALAMSLTGRTVKLF